MKRFILIPALVVLLSGLGLSPGMTATDGQDSGAAGLTLYTTSDLATLAGTWKSAWALEHPDAPLRITTLTAGELPVQPAGSRSIVLMREEDWTSLAERPAWKMPLGRDVVTPIVNAENPFLPAIREQGIAAAQLASLFEDPRQFSWNILVNGARGKAIHVYMTDEPSVREAVSRFLGMQADFSGAIAVASEQALRDAVAADPYAIGFGRMRQLPMAEPGSATAGIALLPIDRNGNGRLDYHEQIYGSLHDFLRGVWIGKYPHALVSSIYVVAPELPSDAMLKAFLKWTLTDGQQYMAQSGYGELLSTERQSGLDALTGEPLMEAARAERWATLKIILYIVVGLAAAAFLVSAIVRSRREERKAFRKSALRPPVINEETMELPAGLYYDTTHTWAYMDKCGYVKVGVDDFLQHVTGPFTRVQLKSPGERVMKGEPFLTLVQDGKQLTIHAPVSGTIRAVNDDLAEEPGLVNMSPYDEGWVYLFEPSNWQRELQFLRMAAAYKDWLRNEFMRLRDFLAVKVNTRTFAYADVALQDGGELTDHVMEKLGPEVWEEFQKHFVDTSC